MSRFLFYSTAASLLAVGIVQSVASLASAAPSPSAQREIWGNAPSTSLVVRALGPFEVQAAIICGLLSVGSSLVHKSSEGLAYMATEVK